MESSKHEFKIGEEVKVREGHPFAGRTGIVVRTIGPKQVTVLLVETKDHNEKDIPVFDDVLERTSTAETRHKASDTVEEAGLKED